MDIIEKKLNDLYKEHMKKYDAAVYANDDPKTTDADSLISEGYHDGFADGLSAASNLFRSKEKLNAEIADVSKSTPKLGIIGRVKYVQNNQDKYPELMKLDYHDMREVL